MNAPTVPAGKTRKTNASSVQAPKKGSDYVVAAPSHENPANLSIIMSVSHSTIEY